MTDLDEVSRCIGKLEGNVEGLKGDMQEVKRNVADIYTIVNGGPADGSVERRSAGQWARDNAPVAGLMAVVAAVVAGVVKGLELAGVI